MKVVHYETLASTLIEDPAAAGVTKRVAIGPDDGAPNFVMRVFTVEPGGHTPKHRHPFEHEVFFYAGKGEVFYEGETHPVGPGFVAFVPADTLHQFVNTGSEPLVFVCVVPE